LIPVPLIDLKFLNELAAGDAETSNRRYSREKRRLSRQVLIKINGYTAGSVMPSGIVGRRRERHADVRTGLQI
jgi:hypothetical protein